MKNFIILILLTFLPAVSSAQERELLIQPSNFTADIHKTFKERLGEAYPVDIEFIYGKQQAKNVFMFVKMTESKWLML